MAIRRVPCRTATVQRSSRTSCAAPSVFAPREASTNVDGDAFGKPACARHRAGEVKVAVQLMDRAGAKIGRMPPNRNLALSSLRSGAERPGRHDDLRQPLGGQPGGTLKIATHGCSPFIVLNYRPRLASCLGKVAAYCSPTAARCD